MTSQLSARDLEQIDAGIRDKYKKVAKTPEGHFKYPTGRDGLKKLQYDGQLVESLPDAVADSYCGVGNPFSLGEIPSGAHVLDIGCGAGVDALLAGELAGAAGKVLGLDLTAEMIQKANSNKAMMQAENVDFQIGDVQSLKGMDGWFDVIISNGVFNLIPEKATAVQYAYKLLKPGGKLFLADQFASQAVSKDLKERVETWFQ
ncbi:MAG: methyltransferase domain-containing protein [Deltaproteobacteria bacterium]|nr:methyltransferase domain-containing protein [Deltaproteobacteria bacterium]